MKEIYERFAQNKDDIETLAYLALLLLEMEMEAGLVC